MTNPVIYFDHAATSWPKPAPVRRALAHYFGGGGGNPGRSGHRMSIAGSRIVEEARDALGELLNAPDAGRIALTKNATEGLNVAIYGMLRPGDHAVTTSLEHNSVMRPLRDLESRGVELTVVQGAPDGTVDPDDVDGALRDDTRLLVTVHGSNVTGAVLPVSDLAAVARRRGVPYLVDASQTAGSLPIDVTSLGVDMLAFTGHKALLGLTGTGGLYVREGIGPAPLLRGGTGSRSDEEVQPGFMPDRYEAGTVNVAGLAGLAAGVHYLLEAGIDAVRDHERALVARLLEGTEQISGLTIYGPQSIDDRCGVVSLNVTGLSSSDVGTILDRDYGILCRPGLHCAPGTHRTIGTFPTGTVRFGFGYSNTVAEVDTALGALDDIASWVRSTPSGGRSHG